MREIILVLLILIGISANGQHCRIGITVINENTTPLQGATICLQTLPDSTIQTLALSDKNGFFETLVQTGKSLAVRVSYLSYEDHTMSLYFDRDTTIRITLIPQAASLAEAVVYANKKPIGIKNGNAVVNVDAIPGSTTETALSIMKKLPGVLTGSNGTVTLYGRPVKFIIDGKDMPGVDVDALLKNMPAISLNKIELVPDKSAKDDASTQSVINISTKQIQNNGHTLSISSEISADRDSKVAGNGSVFYMTRIGKLLFSNSLSYENFLNTGKGRRVSHIEKSADETEQLISEVFRAKRVIENASISYDLGKERKLNFNLFMFNGKENREFETEQTIASDTTDYMQRAYPYDFVLSLYTGYSSKHISLSYGGIYNHTRREYDYQNDYQDGSQSAFSFVKRIENMHHVVRADYSNQYIESRLKVNAGIKIDYNKLNNSDTYTPKTSPSTFFNGEEFIFAGYGALSYTLASNMTIDGGVRAENTKFSHHVSTSGNANRHYWDIIPLFSMNYIANEKVRLSLGFSETLRRPGYESLTPGITYWNDKEYFRGNPMLNPAKEHGLRLNTWLFNKYYFSIGGQYTQDLFREVMIAQPGGVTEAVYLNVADLRRISLLSSIPISVFRKKLYGQISLTYSIGEYINPKNGFKLLSDYKKYQDAGMSIYLEYAIAKHLSINTFLYGKALSLDLQEKTNSSYYINIGAKYSMLKSKALTIAFNVQDLLNTNETYRVDKYNNTIRRLSYKPNSQVFKLSLSYQFVKGRKIEKKPDNAQNDIQRFL